MDSDKDTFTIFYNNKHIDVNALCEDKDIKFCVHLPKGDVLIEMAWDKENETNIGVNLERVKQNLQLNWEN